MASDPSSPSACPTNAGTRYWQPGYVSQRLLPSSRRGQRQPCFPEKVVSPWPGGPQPHDHGQDHDDDDKQITNPPHSSREHGPATERNWLRINDHGHRSDLAAAVTTSGTGRWAPRRGNALGDASRHTRTHGILDGHRGPAAGPVHTVPEHHAS